MHKSRFLMLIILISSIMVLSGCKKTTSSSSIARIENRLTNFSWSADKLNCNVLDDNQHGYITFNTDGTCVLNVKLDHISKKDTCDWVWDPEVDQIRIKGDLFDEIWQLSILSDIDLCFEDQDENYWEYSIF